MNSSESSRSLVVVLLSERHAHVQREVLAEVDKEFHGQIQRGSARRDSTKPIVLLRHFFKKDC